MLASLRTTKEATVTRMMRVNRKRGQEGKNLSQEARGKTEGPFWRLFETNQRSNDSGLDDSGNGESAVK